MAAKKPLDRGEKVIAFIETYCRAPSGEGVGKPIHLEEFQRAFVREIYTNPHGTRTAILSIGRKNGKTVLLAGICLAHIAGPEAIENSQIVSGAMSKDQAALLFDAMSKIINFSPELSKRIKIFPSGKKLLGLAKNVEYKALAADGTTTHGLSAVVAVMDELGQVKGPTNDFVTAVETCQGAYKNPLYIVISTQAPTANDLLSRMIDAHIENPNPKTVCHVYAAPDDCDLEDESAWRAANPALGVFRSEDDLKQQIRKALDMPSYESGIRNLVLNQRVDAVSPFVSRNVWEANGGEPGDPAGKKVWGGLDLSMVQDLTALVLVDETHGVHPTFWLPEVGLTAKSKADKVPYDIWAKQGFLQTTPGKAIEYRYVAKYLRWVFDNHQVQALGFDRYHMQYLKEWLVFEGFSNAELDRFVDFGQGYATMTAALRSFEVKLLNEQLRHGKHPILNMCAQNARVKEGEAEARKFDKRTARGRIDGMVALAMAIGVMPQQVDEEEGTLDDWLNDPVMF